MQIDQIVKFWRGAQQADANGEWAHDLDRERLNSEPHSFNLDYPLTPYVGNVLTAPVIILGANGGYNPDLTPGEFPDDASVLAHLARVDNPMGSDWTFVSRYYDRTNYGHLVATGRAVLVNACAYRSPRLSQEPENRSLIGRLPSAIFTRDWLLKAVFPMAANGERLVVVKRGGQWGLRDMLPMQGVIVDPAPISPQVTGVPFARMQEFLASRS